MSSVRTEGFDGIIDALYRVAADPEAWESLVDILPEGDAGEGPSGPATDRDMARILDVARQVARRADVDDARSQPPVAVLDGALRVVAVTAKGRQALAAGLGEATVGQPLAFSDPENQEVLLQAVGRVRAEGAPTVVRFAAGADRPAFAYLSPTVDGVGLTLAFANAASLVGDLHLGQGLTAAETRIANQFRLSGSLQEAAEALGVSVHTARNQLASVFGKLGIARQSDLIRILTELAVLGLHPDRAPAPTIGAAPPRRDMVLPDGRKMSYRDYGDPAGPVLLAFHEGLGSSLLPYETEAIAGQLGLRVVCADRPAYGGSDRHPGYSFDSVAEDATALCDALGLDRVSIVAVAAGAPFALQTACRMGPRVRRVFLCSARPPHRARPDRRNPLMMFRARLEANEWVTETLFGLLATRISPAMIERNLRKAIAASAGDRAWYAAHPEMVDLIAAYLTEALAGGGKGPADDLRAFRRSPVLTLDAMQAPLSVWHGAEDRLAPVEDLLRFLGERPHDLKIMPGIGQFMILKHWTDLLEAVAAEGH